MFVCRYADPPKIGVLRRIVAARRLGELSRYVLITAFCVDGIGDSKGVAPTFYKGTQERNRGERTAATFILFLS